MITKINYVANDGKEFNTAAECLEYEKMMLNDFKRAMVELDVKLWERYYPEQKGQPLLTDCNFHYECGKFMDGEYGKFIQ